MGDLARDTAVTRVGPGVYEATMSRDWEIWGPQGGYVASIAARAAGQHCGLPRPASLVGHFLGVASFDEPVALHTTTLRAARAAHSVRVSMTQGDRPIFEAMVWATTGDGPTMEHHDSSPPLVPSWRDLPTIDEHVAAMDDPPPRPPFPFWSNFEQRPPAFSAQWNERAPRTHPPEWSNWLRFQPSAAFTDPWIDACRSLILVDVGSWPAAQAHHNTAEVYAPSIDLACELHRIDPTAEWLLVHAHSPSATDGLVASHQRVWSADGRLLASGVSQLLVRAARR